MPMTQRQKEILSKYRHQLKTVFADGVTKMSEPGHARTWFVTYLRAVLATYIDSRTRTVNGKRLSSVLSKNPRRAIQKLIKNTSNRDRKTRSRWAAALDAAYGAGVPPEKLERWFRDFWRQNGLFDLILAIFWRSTRKSRRQIHDKTISITPPCPLAGFPQRQ